MWTGKCHYEIVKEVGKFYLEWHLTKRGRHRKARKPRKKKKNLWDVAWWDKPIPERLLSKLKPWQRCNHLPGIYNLAKKNLLGKHLMRM
jgi:hypothetical protein